MSIRDKFGGSSLAEIATRAQLKATTPSSGPPQPPPEPSPALSTGTVPIAEMALRPAKAIQGERITLVIADPKRCRPWKYHDRAPSWYTDENCKDLIDTMRVEGQRQPVLARRLTGDPNYDFELIYGMRRRYSAEKVGIPLKIETTTEDDKACAVLMHIENANRKDITPMERAISFHRQMEEGLFETKEEMAAAKGISAGMISQYTKAAELMDHEVLRKLFPDPKNMSVTLAYKLATRLADPASKEIIIAGARHLAKGELQPANKVLKLLYDKPDQSKRSSAVRKTYNVGEAGQMAVLRNEKGKITLAFPNGWSPTEEEAVFATFRKAFKELTGS